MDSPGSLINKAVAAGFIKDITNPNDVTSGLKKYKASLDSGLSSKKEFEALRQQAENSPSGKDKSLSQYRNIKQEGVIKKLIFTNEGLERTIEEQNEIIEELTKTVEDLQEMVRAAQASTKGVRLIGLIDKTLPPLAQLPIHFENLKDLDEGLEEETNALILQAEELEKEQGEQGRLPEINSIQGKSSILKRGYNRDLANLIEDIISGDWKSILPEAQSLENSLKDYLENGSLPKTQALISAVKTLLKNDDKRERIEFQGKLKEYKSIQEQGKANYLVQRDILSRAFRPIQSESLEDLKRMRGKTTNSIFKDELDSVISDIETFNVESLIQILSSQTKSVGRLKDFFETQSLAISEDKAMSNFFNRIINYVQALNKIDGAKKFVWCLHWTETAINAITSLLRKDREKESEITNEKWSEFAANLEFVDFENELTDETQKLPKFLTLEKEDLFNFDKKRREVMKEVSSFPQEIQEFLEIFKLIYSTLTTNYLTLYRQDNPPKPEYHNN